MTPLPAEIEHRLEDIRSEIEQTGTTLVEVLYRRANQRSILTFLVDKTGGISLDECAALNQRLGAYFDRLAEIDPLDAGFLQGAYFLEVNSPGLDRPIKAEGDFQRALGQTLRLRVRDEQGSVRDVVGKLTGLTEVTIELEVAGQAAPFKKSDILKANREVTWKK